MGEFIDPSATFDNEIVAHSLEIPGMCGFQFLKGTFSSGFSLFACLALSRGFFNGGTPLRCPHALEDFGD
jgi:hypothetical protein